MILKREGQISVFLSIILLGMLALAGVLVDGSRIATGELQVRRAAECAVKSALAGYNGRLKEEYGFFAFSTGDEEELKNTIRQYLEGNLMITDRSGGKKGEEEYVRQYPGMRPTDAGTLVTDAGASTPDIYGFRVEDVKVTPLFNLSENDVVKEQILEYMKYRAPKAVVEGVWDRLAAVRESGRMAGAYKKKMSIDKLLGKMDKYQQRLKRNIDGSGGDDASFVNGFNNGGGRDALIRDFTAGYEEYRMAAAELRDAEEKRQGVEEGLQSAGAEHGGMEAGSKNAPAQLDVPGENEAGKCDDIRSRLESIRNELETIWNNLYVSGTVGFIEPNARSSDNIRKIMELGRNANEAIQDLEDYMSDNLDGSSEAAKSFNESVTEDVKKLKNLILEGEKAERMLADTVRNGELLSDAVQRMDALKGTLWSADGESMPADVLAEALSAGLEEYNNRLLYGYSRPGKAGSAEDPRKGMDKKVKDGLADQKTEDRDIIDAGIDMDELPSRRKTESPDPDDNTGVSVDFTDEDEKFSGNALDFLSSLGEALPGELSMLRDDIYVGEYIMGTFKNTVPAIIEGDAKKPDMDLRYLNKSVRDTFFQSEVEYILHGRSSEGMNRILTQSQVLFARFSLNTLHVYSDVRKKELAYTTAAALAGWWTGGAGIPIIANLIMCSWGMGEAILDLQDLMKGCKVPFYKSAGDWKLDIGMGKGGKKADPKLALSYHDYLRLFLLLENRGKKLGRLEDLVELNLRKTCSDFRMGRSNTYIRVEAVVSMKYFFITGLFMPADVRMDSSRHLYRVVLYEGY